jgi:hypothetical protein
LPRDPRFSRRLPWVHIGDAWLEFLLSALAALFVLVIPGWLVIGLARRRSWGLFWMLAWFAALSLFLAVARMLITAAIGLGPETGWLHGPLMKGGTHTMDAVRSGTGLLLLALQGLPLVAYPAAVVYAAGRRQWRIIAVLLTSFFTAAVGVTVLTGWNDYQSMSPEQHYSTDGWYWIWFHGVFPGGLGVIAYLLIRTGWRVSSRLIKARWRRAD